MTTSADGGCRFGQMHRGDLFINTLLPLLDLANPRLDGLSTSRRSGFQRAQSARNDGNRALDVGERISF